MKKILLAMFLLSFSLFANSVDVISEKKIVNGINYGEVDYTEIMAFCMSIDDKNKVVVYTFTNYTDKNSLSTFVKEITNVECTKESLVTIP